MAIKLIITDFDGTLVDTFEANYRAYREAFDKCGILLTRKRYSECFGYRFDRFMKEMNVSDDLTKARIKEAKGECYPQHFEQFRVNSTLLGFLRAFHQGGGHTAIASTAREKNLRNALRHIGIEQDFDLILAGENVTKGKPDPEIYLNVLARFGIEPGEALVFEDSPVGFQAAEAAGIRYIAIKPQYFQNGN